MRRLIIVFTIGAVICFCRISLAGDAVLGQKEYKLATYSSAKTATLDIEARNIVGNALNNMNFNINAPGFGINNPWIVSDQYVRVTFSCNYPSWGIKIVTDNKTLYPAMVGQPVKKGVDNQWGTLDDVLSYAGLVNTEKLDNPTLRALLAWQIYKDKQLVGGVGVKPATPTDNSFNMETPDNDTSNDWKSAWAYIVDKNDDEYTDNIILGYSIDEDDDFCVWYNYQVAIFGDGTSVGLAQHLPNADGADLDTEPDKKVGDFDVAIYIAARFCSKDYMLNPVNPVDFILPYGNYETTIYLEIAFE